MGWLQNISEKTCKIVGKANLPVYTVATVALFKGIFRPLFTMMDKHQDPETKKYAAIREFSTELIALPTYIGMSYITEKFAPAFSPKGKNMEQLLHSSKSTLGFLGVCIAALYVIPKLCNMAMPHVMKAFKMQKQDKANKEPLLVVNTPFVDKSVNQIQSPYAKTPLNFNGGMRV